MDTNENKATRYAIKILALVAFGFISYTIIMISEGNGHLKWSNIGATLFLIVNLVSFIVVITDKK